jgi:cystathionine beta-lyase
VITSSEELGEKIKFIQNASGAILSPFDSWLVIRGIETLPLRVKQHSENAQKVAEFLLLQDTVKNVYYPGLAQHKNHAIARRQQTYFGGVVAFDLKKMIKHWPQHWFHPPLFQTGRKPGRCKKSHLPALRDDA